MGVFLMDWTSIIITIITSVATIVTVIIQTRKTSEKTQSLMEVNDFKTYLLVLLSNYPNKMDEIFSVAKHYFAELHGDSFLLPIFEDWLTAKNITGPNVPEWFLDAQAKHPKSK